MSDRWPWRPLGELFEIGAGKTMSAAARTGENKVPFLRTSNVFWDRLDLTTVDEMSIPAHELPEKLVEPGDLLVCEGGEIGRAAIWDGSVIPMAFQNHLHRLRPKTGDVNPRFYVFFLQSAFTQLGIFEGAGNRTTIPNLSANRLAALEVPHPTLETQTALVQVLGTVREAVDAQDQGLRLANELKRAAMASVFSPRIDSDGEGVVGADRPADGWYFGRLEAHADVISTRLSYSELSAMPPVDAEDTVKVLGIKVSDMNRLGNEVELSTAALEVMASSAIAHARCAPPGTIIFPKRGAAIATNKKRIAATWTAFDPNVIGVCARGGLDQRFLFHWFQSFDLRSITEPGPTPQLNKKNLEPLEIPVPADLDEQREIAALFDAVDLKIGVHREKKAALEELFERLLRDAMTGEVSVDDFVLPSRKTAGSAA